MKVRHIIESQQFSRQWLEKELFPLAQEMEEIVSAGHSDILAGKCMLIAFYEPSTRTYMSFTAAMKRLGGEVIYSMEYAGTSSLAKGKTIEDTIRGLCSCCPDVIVLRTNKEGMAKRAAEVSAVPIINAGDGMGQHPTQALLDIYTIQKELGHIDGISIAMVGDLARNRTVRSLSYLLGNFSGIKIYFVSPEVARIRDDIRDFLERHNVPFYEEHALRMVAPKVDVIYQTRTQKERGALLERFETTVNREILGLMKKDAIIMHPLPRNEEISPEVDNDPRAVYFRQAKNGLYVRMALLKMILT